MIIRLLIAIFISGLLACSGPSKSKSTATGTTKQVSITAEDRMKGGTSFDDAIVIRVRTEKTGILEEYRWLSESYPGYSLIRKTRTSKGNRHYDVISFRTRSGIGKTAYFDITGFFGK